MKSAERMEMIARRDKLLEAMEHRFTSLAPIEQVSIPQRIRREEWFRDLNLDMIVKPYAVKGYKFSGLSGKVVGAFKILLALYQQGILTPKTTLVIPTSGNLGYACAMLAGPRSLVRRFEAKDVVTVVEFATPEGKVAHLRMSGATVVSAPEGTSAIEHAKELANQADHYLVDQYTDINNVLAQEWVARGICGTLGPRASVFVCAIGSMASFVGAHRFLPSLIGSHIKIIGVASMPDKAEKVPGSRSELEIVKSGFGYKDVPGYKDYPLIANVSKLEAAIATDEYVRSEVSVGFTGGLASEGFYKLLESKCKNNCTGGLRNSDGNIIPVFLFMDMFFPYGLEIRKLVYGA